MQQDEQLGAYQAALLDLLAQPLTVPEIVARMNQDSAFTAYGDYMASFEPEMIEVAAELVKKWGRRTDDAPASESAQHTG
jgi:hypothetical protein